MFEVQFFLVFIICFFRRLLQIKMHYKQLKSTNFILTAHYMWRNILKPSIRLYTDEIFFYHCTLELDNLRQWQLNDELCCPDVLCLNKILQLPNRNTSQLAREQAYIISVQKPIAVILYRYTIIVLHNKNFKTISDKIKFKLSTMFHQRMRGTTKKLRVYQQLTHYSRVRTDSGCQLQGFKQAPSLS